MARYVTDVLTPWSPQDAFAYLGDLAHFAEWDPAVVAAQHADGPQIGRGAVYDITVRGIGRDITLPYHVTEFEPDERLVLMARTDSLCSMDIVTITPTDTGAVVTYDAEFTLNGLFGLADPLLGVVFRRVADSAAAGLRRAMSGRDAALWGAVAAG